MREESKKRYNLYFLFKDDFECRKLSAEELERVKEKIFQRFFQKHKTKPDTNSS